MTMTALSPNNLIDAAWVVWLISWLAAAAWSSPTERRPSTQRQLVYRVITGVGAYFLFALRAPRGMPVWQTDRAAAWTLAVVTISGFAFTWWARLVLGRLWSSSVTRKAGHAIITTGPYRLVRHPIYSGIILAVLATAASHGTAAGCLGAALIVLGLFIKARMEEGFLRAELGEDQYNAYARKVPMLVPFARA
jgi:protein-S-isoprenylcysteine O-methyltransferase Ste14